MLVLSTHVSRDAQTRRKAPWECRAAGGPPQGPAGASVRTLSVLGLPLTQIDPSPQNQTPLVPLLSLGTARSGGNLGARRSHPSCGWRSPPRSCPGCRRVSFPWSIQCLTLSMSAASSWRLRCLKPREAGALSSAPEGKRAGVWLTEKTVVLHELNSGMTYTVIGHEFKVNESAVCLKCL